MVLWRNGRRGGFKILFCKKSPGSSPGRTTILLILHKIRIILEKQPMKTLIESEALKIKPSKRYIAKNTKSVKLLEDFSNDSDWQVRCNVALNTNCLVRILEKILNDSDCYLRYYVAENPNCPVEILEKLSNDSNCDVRYVANENLNRIRSAKN